MRKGRIFKNVTAVIILLLVVSLIAGCAKAPEAKWWEIWKKPKVQPKPPPVEIPQIEDLPLPPDITDIDRYPGDIELIPLESVTPPGEVSIPQPPPIRTGPEEIISELKTVHFDFDRSNITFATKSILDENVQWILGNPGIQILIEGHCDERGTAEYNLNLGQKRADVVREYFIQTGVQPSSLHTISYGEERPVDPGHTGGAWAKNRRAQFFVYK